MLIGITLVVVGVSLFIAFLTLLKNVRSNVNQWYFLVILFSSVWILSASLHTYHLFNSVELMRLGFLGAVLMSYSIFRFCQSVVGVRVTRKKRIIYLFMAFVCALLSVSPYVIVTINMVPAGESFAPKPDRTFGYPIVLSVIIFFLFKSVATLNAGRRRAIGSKRDQLNIIFLALTLGTVLGFFSNIIIPNIIGNSTPSQYAFLTLVLWTTLLVYAIIHYRFLNLRMAIARAVAYILTLATIVIVYILVVFSFAELLFGATIASYEQRAYYITSALVVSLSFYPLKRMLDVVSKNIFYREAYNANQVLDQLNNVYVRSLDTEKIINKTCHVLKSSLRPESVQILFESNENIPATLKPLTKRLASTKEILTIEELEIQNDSLATTFNQNNIALGASIIGNKNVILGYILLGYRQGGNAYSLEDIELMKLVRDELSIALHNSMQYQEIQRFNATLQQRIEEATRELKQSNEKLKNLDKAKDEFISMASHQLRTPLTSIKGYLSMVLEGDTGELNATQQKVLEEAYASSQRMVYLIGDFLNVSRLKTGKFIVEHNPVNLADITQEEVEQLQSTAQSRGITLVYEKPQHFPQLELDDNKMRQVIMNFIDNAIFYSRSGGQVWIELTKGKGEVVLRVRDSGIGVPVAERKNLFTKFYRATNARKARPDGTGIGLFMAKKVIIAHGGALIFETTEGKGSVFGFRLPLE